MTHKMTINAMDSEPRVERLGENDFLLTIDSGDVELSLQLNKTQVQSLGVKCIHFIPDPSINPRFNNISEEDVYRIPLQGLIHLKDREIQSILREGDITELGIFLWYIQSNEELLNKFINNMPKVAGKMMRDDLKSFPESHPDTASIGFLISAREATQNLMKVINKLKSCGEVGPF